MKYGNYTIEEELGRGGMGIVYKAYDAHLRRHVALKVVTEGSLERFEREYRALAQLQHPNIVTFYEYGMLPKPFFAMEYVVGETLEKKIAEKSLERSKLIDFIIDVCEGLQEAHNKNIFHRDIKPANIIIDTKNRAKIMDFGIAKSNVDEEEKLSKTGYMVGTLLYMSPEQIAGEFSTQTDIYSLGVCIYEAITGRTPYQGTSQINIAYAIQNQDPIRPREFNTSISPYLEAICMKCLARAPKKRYKSMRQLARDLKNFKEQKPIIAKRITYLDQMKSTVKNNKSLFTLIGVFIVFLLTFGLYFAVKEQKLREINSELHVLNQAMNKFTQNILSSDYQDLFARREITTPLYEAFKQSSYLKNAEEHIFLRGVVYGNRPDKKDKEQALRDFKKIIKKYPETFVAYRNIGVLYQQLGEEKKALFYFEKARKLNPQDAKSTYAVAMRLFRSKQHEESLKNFLHAVELSPRNAQYRYELGLLYNALNKQKKAFASFEKAIDLQPHFAAAYRERAILFFRFNQLDKAIADLNRAISLGLRKADTYCDLGSLYLEKKQYDAAQLNCQKAIELDVTHVRSYYTMGLVHQRLKKYTKAVKYYSKSIELEPQIFSYLNRGNVYRDLEQYSKAVDDYIKAISIKSYYPAHANLAAVYNIIGLYEKAIEQATVAIRLQSKYEEYYQRGLAYHKLRMYNKSIKDYDKAIELGSALPAVSKVYDKRGDVYFAIGDHRRAIDNWQKVVALIPATRPEMVKKIAKARQRRK
ncbi:serine/threonine-protein kinase [Candidatus Uabimicrobium amorphum]|uniref:non-specific serine/threonine protein kinase n=1 Tax=Uabimicrobium amorphum TaxID=2596890 RepID=A0A5S9INB3_UABAM|nr:serine/threonine-protein kinase [Candidatus Uabimicrobium amorphum]BBM85063.1 protein kinase [Candidatus Uabimicrobium amorphum]